MNNPPSFPFPPPPRPPPHLLPPRSPPKSDDNTNNNQNQKQQSNIDDGKNETSPSSSPNRPSFDKEYYQRREIEDEMTAKLFQQVFQEIESLVRSQNFGKYTQVSKEERRIIQNSTMYMAYQGMAGSLITFGVLRGYRSGILSRLLRRTTTPASSTTTTGSNPLRYGFWLGIDLSISGMVGCGMTLNAALSGKLIQGMAQIPLLPGTTNTISQTTCKSTIEVYERIQKEHNHNSLALDVLDKPQTLNLQGFQQLYYNCLRRKSYEKMLYQKQQQEQLQKETAGSVHPEEQNDDGKDSSTLTVVEVPPPGVPNDFPISFGDDDEEENGNDDNESSTSSFCIVM